MHVPRIIETPLSKLIFTLFKPLTACLPVTPPGVVSKQPPRLPFEFSNCTVSTSNLRRGSLHSGSPVCTPTVIGVIAPNYFLYGLPKNKSEE